MSLRLDPALPAMRAHGVPELAAYRRGETGLAEAARLAVLATMQYAKRQATWFRNQTIVSCADQHTIHSPNDLNEQLSERWMAGMQKFMHG